MIESEYSSTLRSVTWNKQQPFEAAMSSAAILKAISTIGTGSSYKSKMWRRLSKAAPKWSPKLVFEYGPTSFRGLLLHRKIKIAPFAEHFQKKYPDLRVYYHPVTDYNRVCVKLLGSIVTECTISNLAYTRFANITSQTFYKIIDKAIQRVFDRPNLMTKPFKDPMCLMTHNLDIDYDRPWYRTQFPVHSNSIKNEKVGIPRQKVSFDQNSFITMHSKVQWDRSIDCGKLWDTFKSRVEQSAGYDSLEEVEGPMENEKQIPKKKPLKKPSRNNTTE